MTQGFGPPEDPQDALATAEWISADLTKMVGPLANALNTMKTEFATLDVLLATAPSAHVKQASGLGHQAIAFAERLGKAIPWPIVTAKGYLSELKADTQSNS